MTDESFFKKVMSYLAELNRGNRYRQIEDDWLSVEEVYRIKIILSKLGFIDQKGDDFQVTRKGLNVLLYFKMDKIGSEYNDQILKLLLKN